MEYNFWQILILVLIALLFAKDYLPALLKKFFGIEIKNGNGHKNGEIDALKTQIATLQDNHLHTLEVNIDKLTERIDKFAEDMIKHNTEEIIILRDIKETLKK